MNASYQVIICGVNDNFSKKQVMDNLVLLFKVTEDKLAHVFATPNFVIKGGLDLDKANKYLAAVEKCGCTCVIEPENHRVDVPAPLQSEEANQPTTKKLLSKFEKDCITEHGVFIMSGGTQLTPKQFGLMAVKSAIDDTIKDAGEIVGNNESEFRRAISASAEGVHLHLIALQAAALYVYAAKFLAVSKEVLSELYQGINTGFNELLISADGSPVGKNRPDVLDILELAFRLYGKSLSDELNEGGGSSEYDGDFLNMGSTALLFSEKMASLCGVQAQLQESSIDKINVERIAAANGIVYLLKLGDAKHITYSSGTCSTKPSAAPVALKSPPSENEIWTQTVLFFVHEPMVAFKCGRYPVDKIINQFPVIERRKIKESIDAVVELGFFVMVGSDIQLTDKGEMLYQSLFEVSRKSADERNELAKTAPMFAALLTTIQQDSRLNPPSTPTTSAATTSSSTKPHTDVIPGHTPLTLGNKIFLAVLATWMLLGAIKLIFGK